MVISSKTIIDRENSIATLCELLSVKTSLLLVSTCEATSMDKHDGWSKPLATIRRQVRIKQQDFIVASLFVNGFTILDVLFDLYLVLCEDRVDEAVWTRISIASVYWLR